MATIEGNKKTTKCKETGRILQLTPKIPLEPLPGMVLMRVIDVKSEVEKRMEKGKIIIPDKDKLRQQIQQEMQQKGILNVYKEHPDQAEIVAIRERDAAEVGLGVGDKVMYLGAKDAAYVVIFNKEIYRAYRSSSLICRYITDKT
jgi:hypothetical protein